MASPAILTKSGSILASRGARSCDICGKERARSYCAADDAYLCDRCDGSVHSANPVAGRHARVRLGPNGAPLKIDRRSSCSKKTRKKKKKKRSVSSLCKMQAKQVDFKLLTCSNSWMNRNSESLLIPQSSATSDQALSKLDDDVIAEQKIIQPLDLYSMKAEDGELAQEVPVFEPLMADLESACHEDVMQEILSPAGQEIDAKDANARPFSSSIQLCEVEEEVNSTIEAGSISLDGVSEDYELHMSDLCNSSSSVEAAETSGFGIPDLNMWNDETCVGVKNPFKTKGDTLRFDQNQEIGHVTPRSHTFLAEGKAIQSTFCLRLNYEDVLSAWSDRGSLWMDGERPQTVPIDASFLDQENLVHQQQVGQVPVVKALHAGAAAREARVLRYKEKRQTRLFAKKIRYEVRKLNAERRPRMKVCMLLPMGVPSFSTITYLHAWGRFVKKTHGLEDNLEGELQY